jgi:hypothetical protein
MDEISSTETAVAFHKTIRYTISEDVELAILWFLESRIIQPIKWQRTDDLWFESRRDQLPVRFSALTDQISKPFILLLSG